MNAPLIEAQKPAAAAPRLQIEHVRRQFGATVAVADVSLDVAQGETVCLLGPSGCGKTTTLRIAAGAERPDAGRVLIGGRLVAGEGVFVSPEARGIGLMFQDFALFPHLNVLGNVAFGLKRFGRRERAQRAMAALERVRLAKLAKSFPHELSGGEQQRVALARALAPEPAVILMDEPFSGLDRELRASVREETLEVLRTLNAATLIVTHDPEEAMQIADRVVLLRAGRVVQSGPPEELWRQPADLAAALFFGEINRLPGMAQGGRVITPWGAIDSPETPDGPVDLVVRPDALHVGPTGAPELEVVAARFLGGVYRLEGRFAAGGAEVPLVARLPLELSPCAGDRIPLVCEPNAIIIFSHETEGL